MCNKIPKIQPNTCLNDNNNLPGQCSAISVLFVASDVVPDVYNKPNYLSMILFKFETLEKV